MWMERSSSKKRSAAIRGIFLIFHFYLWIFSGMWKFSHNFPPFSLALLLRLDVLIESSPGLSRSFLPHTDCCRHKNLQIPLSEHAHQKLYNFPLHLPPPSHKFDSGSRECEKYDGTIKKYFKFCFIKKNWWLHKELELSRSRRLCCCCSFRRTFDTHVKCNGNRIESNHVNKRAKECARPAEANEYRLFTYYPSLRSTLNKPQLNIEAISCQISPLLCCWANTRHCRSRGNRWNCVRQRRRLGQKIEAMWLLWHQTQHTTTDVICHPRKRLTACDDEPLVVSTRELVDHHMNTSWSKFDTHTRCSFSSQQHRRLSSFHLICLLMYLLMNLTERRGKNESFSFGSGVYAMHA